MVEPHHIHWIDTKNLLRYLCGTINYGLRYTARNLRLHGYTNANWVGSAMDCKRTFGCCFSLGSSSISWMSRKQRVVALITTEAECITTSNACTTIVWR